MLIGFRFGFKTIKNIMGKTMLVLTRDIGQIIHIGDDITVIIRESEKDQTSVEVDAPQTITVHRENIYYCTKISTPNALEQASEISPAPEISI